MSIRCGVAVRDGVCRILPFDALLVILLLQMLLLGERLSHLCGGKVSALIKGVVQELGSINVAIIGVGNCASVSGAGRIQVRRG